MDHNQPHNNFRQEQGFALVAALVLLLVLFGLTMAVANMRASAARNQVARDEGADQYWQARARSAEVEAAVRTGLPQLYEADLRAAKRAADGQRLPAFDPLGTSQSRPLYDPVTGSVVNATGATSLLGDLSPYVVSKSQQLTNMVGGNDRQEEVLAQLARLAEAYRKMEPSKEEAYTLDFRVDARSKASAGDKGRLRSGGLITLGSADPGCGTTARIVSVSPTTIFPGWSATLNIEYTAARQLRVRNVSGSYDRTVQVPESAAPQRLPHVVPGDPFLLADEEFFVEAVGPSTCAAASAGLRIDVVQTDDAEFVSDNLPAVMAAGQTYNVSVVMRNTGTTNWRPGQYQLSSLFPANWGVSQVAVPGNVGGRGLASLGGTGADGSLGTGETVTFNLTITASAGCPASSSFQWRMRATPGEADPPTLPPGLFGDSSPLRTPQVNCACPSVDSMAVAPGSITLGQPTTVSWTQTGGESASLVGSGFAGTVPVNGPQAVTPVAAGTQNYTLSVANPGGTCTVQRTASVEVIRPCSAAVSLVASAASVTAGGNVTLTWSASDSDVWALNSLDGGPGGGALPGAAGAVSINFPNPGTYRYAVTANDSGLGASCTATSNTVTIVVDPPPPADPTASLSASAASVNVGSSFTLTWGATNADQGVIISLSGGPGGGPVAPPAGGTTAPITPGATGNFCYTFTATNTVTSRSATSAQVCVNVVPVAVPTASLSASRAALTLGESFTLTWASTNADSGTINSLSGGPGGGPVAPAAGGITGPIAPAATGTYCYTFTATISGTGASATSAPQTCVQVNAPAAPTASLSASAASVPLGQSYTLTWGSTNADSGTINSLSGGPGGGPVPAGQVAGGTTAALTPGAIGNYCYTYTATGPGGSATSNQVCVQVTAAPCNATALLTASRASITLGESFTLTWSSNDSNRWSIDQRIGNLPAPSGTTGAITPGATGTFTYTFTAEDSAVPGCVRTSSVTVTVNPPPSGCPVVNLRSGYAQAEAPCLFCQMQTYGAEATINVSRAGTSVTFDLTIEGGTSAVAGTNTPLTTFVDVGANQSVIAGYTVTHVLGTDTIVLSGPGGPYTFTGVTTKTKTPGPFIDSYSTRFTVSGTFNAPAVAGNSESRAFAQARLTTFTTSRAGTSTTFDECLRCYSEEVAVFTNGTATATFTLIQQLYQAGGPTGATGVVSVRVENRDPCTPNISFADIKRVRVYSDFTLIYQGEGASYDIPPGNIPARGITRVEVDFEYGSNGDTGGCNGEPERRQETGVIFSPSDCT